MPVFIISTNVARADIPEDFTHRLWETLVKLTGKPRKFISVRVLPDQLMCRGGSTAPCAECHLYLIGGIDEENNLAKSVPLTEIIHQDLTIDKDRLFIFFYDLEGANVCWNGQTLAAE